MSHSGILFRLCSLGICGPLLSVLSAFLTDRSQYVVVEGVRNHCVNVVSGVPQCSVLGPLLFLTYTSELFNIVQNDLFSYADDSTLVAVIDSPADRLDVAQSLNRDLIAINDWYNTWGMKLNAEKTKTMSISRSRTAFPRSPPLTIDNIILQDSTAFNILGVTIDSKLTFQRHVRSMSKSVSHKLGIMRKA